MMNAHDSGFRRHRLSLAVTAGGARWPNRRQICNLEAGGRTFARYCRCATASTALARDAGGISADPAAGPDDAVGQHGGTFPGSRVKEMIRKGAPRAMA